MTPLQAFASDAVRGIDVSHHQGHIDWDKVFAAGYKFVWVKLTEGGDYIDPLAADYTQGASAAGLRVGGYHFARPDTAQANDPEKEAEHFADALYATGETVVNGLPPVLDYEVAAKGMHGDEWIRRFQERATGLLGVRPWLYTYYAVAREMPLTVGAQSGLWLADYRIIAPGVKCDAWQYTCDGVVPGVKGACDLNLMSQAAWKKVTWSR